MRTKLLTTVIMLFLCSSLMCAGMLPRPEYPRPQFERTEWINLNGEWTCTLDPVQTGWERKLAEKGAFETRINVPFAPESDLSGIGHKEFIPCIWYQRVINIPSDWAGKDVVLNFGAVYYKSEVYIDGKFVTRHFGGSDSFSVDITRFVTPGSTHSLVVNAVSDLRSRMQPAGKQSLREDNFECMYTRTTGIWQTVWMEAVDPRGLEMVRTTTDIDRSEVSFRITTRHKVARGNIRVTVYDKGKVIASETAPAADGSIVVLPLKKAKLWSPETPNLYDVTFEVLDLQGNTVDRVSSYFGMRKVHIEGNKVFLNNEPYYQRLVLDQGFYQDGVWTAPSDEALKRDIELSKSVGFNGARLHQKVFEERFHYWADHIGYLTWGESPSWGLDANDPVAARNFISEWCRIVERDANHPSIITWTPFNEEFWPDETEYPRFISDVYDITRSIDPTRPVNTVSGGVHCKTDIWTYHDYQQDASKLGKNLGKRGMVPGPNIYKQEAKRGNVGFNRPVLSSPYEFPSYDGSIPYILDEFGGIRCMEANPPEDGAWGYGSAPDTKEEFYTRLESQVKAIMNRSDLVWGWCYTQLTDVFQEQNGIFYFDRSSKYDPERLRSIFGMPVGQAADKPSDYRVCAFVWPSCHDDSLGRTNWEAGIGEWEVIQKGNPRFEGHYQPKQPLWGYEMDNDPVVVEKWIKTALSHGVNTFIYDWYWFDHYPYLESALNDGFLQAPSNEKMEFFIMWANHDVKHNYWNYHKWGKDDSILWNGAIDPADWPVIVKRVISQYFHRPNYAKIDGCPIFAMFSTDNFFKSFGSEKEAAAAMDYFREEVKKAGFPGLHYMMMDGGGCVFNESNRNRINGRKALNPDSWAWYNMGGFDCDYMVHCANSVKEREDWDKYMNIPVFPTVSVGWDDTPRFPAYGPDKVTRFNHTPEVFRNYLQKAKDYADRHPGQPRMVMINAWNEWVEGSYLLPDKVTGFGYLEAVRAVFGPCGE